MAIEDKAVQGMTAVQRRLLDASVDLMTVPPEHIAYQHVVLCQCGLPRRQTAGKSFERRTGYASLKVQTGELWNGRRWIEHPLPYGTKPRLALIHVSSRAVLKRTPVVEVGHSVNAFLQRLGLDTSGKEHAMFQKQMKALAACEMRLGIGSSTVRVQPIREFAAWLNHDDAQQSMWPGVITLTHEFYTSLLESAVPLDPRALGALSHSSLALDLYSWLAHRLCRVRTPAGEKVGWASLQEQFGQEFSDSRNFVRKLLIALRAVKSVYVDARLDLVRGGLVLLPSKPPVPKLVIHG